MVIESRNLFRCRTRAADSSQVIAENTGKQAEIRGTSGIAPWADADERDRMARIRTCPRGWSDEDVFAQLIKPKARNNE